MVVAALASNEAELEFTPLEFETIIFVLIFPSCIALEFTPLEFETVLLC